MIKQTDIRRIVHRVHRASTFDVALEQVREVLENCEGVEVQKERVAYIDLPEEQRSAEYLAKVRDYLPENYRADYLLIDGKSFIGVYGFDDHGWTLDGYVIPRLASGLIAAREIK